MNTSFPALCEDVAARHGIPALAAATAIGGRVEVVAVGCEAEARFRIASITKPFTALLALSTLDLEAETGIWPPEVRVRHLLSHTSGFDCELPQRDLTRFGDGEDALARAVAELPDVLRFVGVEEIWSYANTGFWLAGHLSASRSRCTYEEALTRRVIGPFGLEATSFGEPDLAGSGPEADAGPYPRARRPSGGLVSNVTDVLEFGRRLLDEPAFAQMAVPQGRPIGGVYGLGLFGERVGDVDVWGHSGSYGGFQTSLLTVPSRQAVFAGLTSSGTGQVGLFELEDAFFEQVVGTPRRIAPFVQLPAEALAGFAGPYVNSEERYEVAAADGGLEIRIADEQGLFRPIGERAFRRVDGRDRIDFPRSGLARFGSRLARRAD
jgi:D-alanyl-D-alanine carboxypeptidase